MREIVQNVLGRSRESLADENNNPYRSTNKVSGFQESIHELHQCIEVISKLKISEELKTETDYVLSMEIALLSYEVGRRLGASAGNESLLEGSKIYQQMRGDHPTRGIVLYRLARVNFELNDKVQARDQMRALIEDFPKFDLELNHWAHASANRILGFWLWESVRREGKGSRAPIRPDDLDSVAEAAACSLRASDITVSDQVQPDEYPGESPRVMALSNLMFFAIEYLEAGGNWEGLEARDITRESFEDALNHVSQFDESADADYHKLNTLRRVFLYQEDVERAKHYASLAMQNLEKNGFVDRGGQSEPEYVLRECAKTVSV